MSGPFLRHTLPRWPTSQSFPPPAIRLPDEMEWMPKSTATAASRSGTLDCRRTPTLGGFLSTVKEVTQNGDNEQGARAGFRDRIVHIPLAGEGA